MCLLPVGSWGRSSAGLGRSSSSVRSTSGRESSQSCLKLSPELAAVWFPFPSHCSQCSKPFLGSVDSSPLLLPTIALQNSPTCECWGLETQALTFQRTAGSARASKELETPQEELGVMLSQQEGFVLFEVDNECFA